MLLRETLIYDDGHDEVLIRPEDIGEAGQLIVDMEGVKKEIYAGDLWFEEGDDGSRH